MSYIHENKHGKFEYHRDETGAGRWVCIRGRYPGGLGSRYNVYVPSSYASQLTAEAKRSGADPNIFKRPKVVKEPRTLRVRRKKVNIGVKLFE